MKFILLFMALVSFSSITQARVADVVGSVSGCLAWSRDGGCTWASYCEVYSNGRYSCEYFVPGTNPSP